MSWLTSWPESLKKRACRFLLQHYLGQFLQEKLRVEQLSVDLYNGTGNVSNVALDICSLNEILDQARIPMELVDGYIDSIVISIPWKAILKDNCKVEIKGLEITLQPKYRMDGDLNDVTDSFYRSLGSMTTSMQLAEGCLKEEENETHDSTLGGLFEGLDVVAQTIESVLSRVKVSLTDIVVRVEHLPQNSKTGIAVEMRVDRIDYFDEITMEAEGDIPKSQNSNLPNDKKQVFEKDSVTCKRFRATGVRIYLDEFPENLRTSSDDSPQNGCSSPITVPDIPEFQTMTDPEQEFQQTKLEEEAKTDGPLLIGEFFGMQELKLRIRQDEHTTAPKIDAECFLGSCGIFLTPHQVHLLAEFTSGISSPATMNPTGGMRNELNSFQTNDFASCTDGIKLSPYSGNSPPDAKIRAYRQNETNGTYVASHSQPEVEGDEQFFSMEGSKLYSHSPPEPSEYSTTEYGTSVYSQSTGFTPSFINRPYPHKIPSVRPSTKMMGAGYYRERGCSFSSSPKDMQRQSSGHDEDKSIANHCRYQLHIRAMALTVLHTNPLPLSASSSDSLDTTQFCSYESKTSQTTLKNSDVGSSSSTLSCDKNLTDSSNCHKRMCEKYLKNCETTLEDVLMKDKEISSVRSDLASVCSPHDHLRMTAAHIHLSTELKASHRTNTELSLGKAELTECLFIDSSPAKSSGKHISTTSREKRAVHSGILVFEASSDAMTPASKVHADPPGVSANIRIHMSSHETSRMTNTSLHVHLSACESEVDISIVDRISTLLYPPENLPKVPSNNVSLVSPTSCYGHSNPDAFNRQTAFKEALADDTKEKQLHLDVSATFLRINFRFPIADLRPEMERRPWYNRSLRDETLILEARDIAFLTTSLGSSTPSSYAQQDWRNTNPSTIQQKQEFEITVKDLHVLYSDEPNKGPGKPKSFLRISQSPADLEPHGVPLDANSDLDCPHIKVTINPAQQGNSDILLQGSTLSADYSSPKNMGKSQNEKSGTWFDDDFSLYGSQEGSCGGNPSPFSQRRVVYNDKEMIFPGDPSEISNFSEHAVSTSLISLSIHLPAVNVFLISKSFFENLYNRINNDILLWAPAAPKPHGKVKSWFDSKTVSCLGDSQLHYLGSEKGLDCATQLLVQGEDDGEESIGTDSDSDDEIRTNFSGRPSLLGASRRVVKSVHGNGTSQQSLISISMKIGYGRVSAKCNVLLPDETVSRTEHGEVVVMLESANIFNVASYCGNPLLDYVCIQIAELSLYHKANIPSLTSVYATVDLLSVEPPSHLDKVLSRCEDGISQTFGKNTGNNQNMLVLAIKIQTEEERPMKRCLISAGVSRVVLHHRFARTGMSWLEQIIDFVDATDDDVPGYKPPSFITEVHLNVKNSAAVYKPLYMDPPVKAVVTASSFSLLSNIVAGAAKSVLDIVIDEAKLFITNQKDAEFIDLLSDFACVLDINAFELCVEISTPSFSNSDAAAHIEDKNPSFDIQVSNNLVRLRTCADSCAALGALVRYLADDGDFPVVEHEDDDDDSVSDYHNQEDVEPSGWTDHESPILEGEEESDDDDKNMTDLMADAMEDIFEDAKSDFEEIKKKYHSAMTESMYDFSSSKKRQPAPLSRKSADIMSQSVMIPSELHKHRGGRNNSHVLPRHRSRDLYYSAFGKTGICSHPNQPNDDEFCIIDDDLQMSHRSSEPEIKYCCSRDDEEEVKEIEVVDNHFKPAPGKIDRLQAPEHFPTPVVRYTLKELSCVWYMYGGFDFKNLDAPSRKNSGSGSHTSPIRREPSPIQLRYNAKQRNVSINQKGSNRNSTMLMELHLTKVRARYEQYPEDTYEAARIVFIVSEFEVLDKLQSSSINKFLYRFHSESSPRQSQAKALMLKILQIRPEGSGSPTESRLRISLQPLRLNIDQDTLNFLTKFFTELSSSVEDNSSNTVWMAPASTYETAVGSPPSSQNRASPKNIGTPYASPVMTRPKSNSLSSTASGDLPVGSSLSAKSMCSSGRSFPHEPPLQPIFFREVVFSPEVPIRLDYHGKRIDTEQGTISGLLMGLGQLNCSQLRLKRIVHRHGVLGVDKLMTFLLNEWAADIRANQLPLILGGVGPMHSVVQLFKGVRDLVYLPVEQYRKDGRLVRGLQRGATSFGTSTAMAALEITNRAIGLVKSAAETTYDLVSPQELQRRELHAQRNWRTLGNHAIRRQPADIREGVSNAFTVVKQGVEDTAGAIVRAAQKEHERLGVTGAVGGVVRHIPSTLVKPVILATEATSNVLSGIRNQIQPDAKRQDEDKWKNLNGDDMP